MKKIYENEPDNAPYRTETPLHEMKTSIAILLMLCTISLFSQSSSIRGRITDPESTPLSFVAVLLYENEASEAIRGTTTDENGDFKFSDLAPATYKIHFSFIGFKTKEFELDLSSEKNMGIIILEENTEILNEATVVYKMPTISKLTDRIIFNVENTSFSTGNSWDILKSTPGVITIQDNLMIRGEGASVYLNNRKVQITSAELKTFLEGFSGANVQSIEVITNPPAQYDAESGPILNINTSKSAALGYKGRADGSYTQSIYPKYSIGTSHFFKNRKMNVYLNYNFSPKKEYKEDDASVNFIDETNTVFTNWQNIFDRTTRSEAHDANLILDYDLNDKNSLNLTSNLLLSPKRTFDNNIVNESYNAQSQLDSTFISKSHLESDLSNFAVDLSYKHLFNKEGSEIMANVHFTDYERHRDQNVTTNYYDSDNDFLQNISFFTNASQNVAIYTAQIDFETPIGSTKFRSGIKASFIDSESGIDFYDVLGNDLTLNSGRSDDFMYDEKVYAGYASISKDWDKISAKVGLRAEQIKAEGISVTLDQINDQDYLELFPTFFLQYRLHEDHSIAFDYSRRVNRPRYEDLNPFAYFLNENAYQEGNPSLQPDFSHRFNLNYSLKNKYFFDIYYRDRGNFITHLSFQDNEALTVRTSKQNAIEATSYGLDFVHSRSLTDFWFFYTYISIFHEDETFLAIESNNQEVTNDYNGIFAQALNSFTLSKDGTLTGELTVAYWSGYIFGSFKQAANTNLSIGLRKTLWNKRAAITMTGDDILGKANSRMTSRYLNQDYSYLAVPESRYIRFGFVYNFGNFRLQDNKRQIEKTERDRLDTQ